MKLSPVLIKGEGLEVGKALKPVLITDEEGRCEVVVALVLDQHVRLQTDHHLG